MSWSSEALKKGIVPFKASSEMTDNDWNEFRNNLNPDEMGFDGIEGYPLNDLEENQVSYVASPSTSNDYFQIKDNLTTINYNNGYISRIKYIVVHYTANNGDTAWGNTNFFKSTYRGASAHYFVDENPIIWRCIKDEDIAWHCGGGLQGSGGHSFFNICTNTNSIGIEMCSRKYANGTYYFKEETITNCVNLVKHLMKLYNVPESRVIRHYDVTGKICPAPFVNNNSAWNDFKYRLVNDESKHYAEKYLNTLISKNIITDKSQWEDLDSPITKCLSAVLIDKMTGGTWKSDEANKEIHWAQPMIISLCGKKIITDKDQWLNTLDDKISKALLLALVCNLSGGILDKYKNRNTDHWARNCLDTLCDRSIIHTPTSWTDFEAEVSKGQTMALLCKAIYK